MLSAFGQKWAMNLPLDLARPAFAWPAVNNLTVPAKSFT
jgi:hypothetical protein